MSNRLNHRKSTPYPKREPPIGSRQQTFEARTTYNWRVKQLDNGQVLALEPGRVHEQVFEHGPDPFWEAVEYAARCLRGETDPAALP